MHSASLTLAIRAFMLEMSVGEIIAWTRGILSGVRNQVPLAAMWFMPCLFCMEIYHHVLTKLLKNCWLVLAVCAVISFWVKMVHEGPEYLWGVEVAGRYLVYYAMGDVFFAVLARKAGGRPFGIAAKGAFAAVAAFSFYILYVNFYFGLTYFSQPGRHRRCAVLDVACLHSCISAAPLCAPWCWALPSRTCRFCAPWGA